MSGCSFKLNLDNQWHKGAGGMLCYEDLTEPERAVWCAVEAGILVELPIGASDSVDPSSGGGWGKDREVRAQLLAELLTGRNGPTATSPRALKLHGARIVGMLDLEATTLVCPFILQACYFEEAVNLSEAQAPAVRLRGCHVPGLNAKQLQTRGDLELAQGFVANGEVNLRGAHIGGDLLLAGATLTGHDGVALRGGGLRVEQSMRSDDGFTAMGEVNLLSARIGGNLSFVGAALSNPKGSALLAARISVGGAMFCGHAIDNPGGFSAKGEVRLVGARVGGFISFRGATLANPGGIALAADGLTVEQSISFTDGFAATGEVRLLGARLGGDLIFTGATLSNPGGYALNASRLSAGGAMFCGHQIGNPGGFSAQGEVRLVDAHIGAFLTFDGASLANPGGAALAADRLRVDQTVFCRRGFHAHGEVCLRDGHVKSLVCSDGVVTNPDGAAVNAEGLTVAHDVLWTKEFKAEGEVSFRAARIGGQLAFDGAILISPNSDRGVTLQELDAQVLVLRPHAPPDGHVDLTHARVRVLVDPQAAWPGSLGLWSFVYDVLHEHPRISVAARLRWLERDPRGYSPQPYEQLAGVYRRAGRDDDARRVAIAKQRRRRKDQHLVGKAWGLLLDGLVGYGYRTWQAGLWLLGFLLVGWLVFARAYPQHMTPTTRPGEPLPAFQPLMYALDTLLPVIDLHQQDNWVPHGLAQWWAWASILAGWALTTAVVAALTGIMKKE